MTLPGAVHGPILLPVSRNATRGAAAAALATFAAARSMRRRRRSRSTEYERFATRLRLSHEALRRNLGATIERIDHDDVGDLEAFGQHVELLVRFLLVHHDGEDAAILPALRAASRLRTTDAAHLARWSSEHRLIEAAGRALARAAAGANLTGIRRGAADVRALLGPHMESEETILSPRNLAGMISEEDLRRAQESLVRRANGDRLAMAYFLAHSLLPEEQRAIFGDAPWFFRRVILPRAGRTRFRAMEPYAWSSELRI